MHFCSPGKYQVRNKHELGTYCVEITKSQILRELKHQIFFSINPCHNIEINIKNIAHGYLPTPISNFTIQILTFNI